MVCVSQCPDTTIQKCRKIGAQDQYIGKIVCVAGSEIDCEVSTTHDGMLASNSRRRGVGKKDPSPRPHENRD